MSNSEKSNKSENATLSHQIHENWKQHPRIGKSVIILFVFLLIITVLSILLTFSTDQSTIRAYTVNNDKQYPVTISIKNDAPLGELVYTTDGTDPGSLSYKKNTELVFSITERTQVIVQRRFLGLLLCETSFLFDINGIVEPSPSKASEEQLATDRIIEVDPEFLLQLSEEELEKSFPWVFIGMVTISGYPTDTIADKYEFVGFDWKDNEMIPQKMWNHYVRQPVED